MGTPYKEPRAQIQDISARDIRKIAKADYDRPSLFAYFLITFLFFALNALYYFFWVNLTRPIWSPISDLLSNLLRRL